MSDPLDKISDICQLAPDNALTLIEEILLGDTVSVLQRRVAKLEAQLSAQQSAEPVAWINKDGTYVELSTKSTVYGSHTIPLYAAPQSLPEVKE